MSAKWQCDLVWDDKGAELNNEKWVNLYEPENESSRDDFTAKRIAGTCINIKSGFAAESSIAGSEL